MKDSKIIVALDGMTTNGAINFCKEYLDPDICRVKVGKELFTLGGPPLIQVLSDYDFEVFLDLKFHDIPNTVAKAVAAAAELGVWMVNVHASGGLKMMQKAKEALIPYGNEAPILIAVTVLTSMDEQTLHTLGVKCSPAEQVTRLARLTFEAGLDGVVSSALEASNMRRLYGEDFKIITPGIRPKGSSSDDQERIMTPRQAIDAGSDYLVMGRPITKANNPRSALEDINVSIMS